MARIDIAMPCYNVAPWLDDGIESLLAQEGGDWRLVARDDASTDQTAALLAGWAHRLGPRMLLLEGDEVNLGAVGNFNAVLGATESRWVMTADPDDIWLPGRLARTLAALTEAEARFGADMPLAVCTDAQVIDERGRPIATSYWRWARCDPRRATRLAAVAMESPALGSTMALNRALLDLALPIAADAPYHDSWLALTAVAFGRLIPLPDCTVRYRRHSGNEAAEPFGHNLLSAAVQTLTEPGAPRRRLRQLLFSQAAPQAAAFADRFGDRLAPGDAAALRALGRLRSLGPLERRRALIRHGLWYTSPLKNAALLAMV
jgi:glycosyltransferase involved in cell wall biosynthesis